MSKSGIFSKCGICGKRMYLLDFPWTLADGKICNNCAKKVGLHLGDQLNYIASLYTLAEIKALIINGKQVSPNKPNQLAAEKEREKAYQALVVKVHSHNPINRSGVLFDNKDKKIFNAKSPDGSYIYESYESLVSYQPIERKAVINGHGVGRALVGGLLAGGVGAIVGAATKENNYNAVQWLSVVMNFKDGKTRQIVFVNQVVRTGDPAFISAFQFYKKLCAQLDQVIQENKNEQVKLQPQIDPADELAKFKKLADDGIITQQEFEAKKKQLLGL
ncbi:hypothetical protein FAM21834_02114 [Lentilactobacillus parabuchneri]|uniref:SHOCT domain-containing protein n=1 Tax=Lentilactobacillus parabuchneri TaxID=152331 RepID=A0A1X1FCJ3_9LACO|nr:SHOCT domain-containing protein [Lentilactobacillus parabuchneri]ORN06469.1 hypothetical protein FAM21834_02114 [Lentilactobacillus parabuchneri]ORN26177.1 hypothetical protein FAM23169_02077 [Lentilactobacillus parabuchneri]TLQ32230.1 hypothetical protein FEZ39_03760 [Lentilactobacillus parabuchneri]